MSAFLGGIIGLLLVSSIVVVIFNSGRDLARQGPPGKLAIVTVLLMPCGTIGALMEDPIALWVGLALTLIGAVCMFTWIAYAFQPELAAEHPFLSQSKFPADNKPQKQGVPGS